MTSGRLSAILAADIVGYSRHSRQDENAILEWWRAARRQIVLPLMERYGGRIFKFTGDGFLAEFSSVKNAVQCACEAQFQFRDGDWYAGGPTDYSLRMGIHLGEVVPDGDDLFGDGVNIAARLESIADPGGVSVSVAVHELVKRAVPFSFDDTGYRKVKNIDDPLHVFRVHFPESSPPLKNEPLFDLFGAVSARKRFATGQCHCGHIRFDLTEQNIGTGMCNCRICQRTTGAPMVAWVAFPVGSIRFLGDEPTYFNSSPIAIRSFCPRCGSALTYRLIRPMESDYFVVFTAALDNPEDFPPEWHGCVDNQMPWIELNDSLPRIRSEESKALQKAWESVGVFDPSQWGPARKPK